MGYSGIVQFFVKGKIILLGSATKKRYSGGVFGLRQFAEQASAVLTVSGVLPQCRSFAASVPHSFPEAILLLKVFRLASCQKVACLVEQELRSSGGQRLNLVKTNL